MILDPARGGGFSSSSEDDSEDEDEEEEVEDIEYVIFLHAEMVLKIPSLGCNSLTVSVAGSRICQAIKQRLRWARCRRE